TTVCFETLDDRILLSADILPIEGAIDVPGEQDAYVFTLTQPQVVFFDSLTPDSRLSWTLESEDEVLVSEREFDSDSDARSLDAPVLSLQPGEYRLTIDGSNDHTGEYGFRLLNVGE